VRIVKRVIWLAAGVAVVAALMVDAVHPGYVLAPLLGVVILRLGWATFSSLAGGGGAHVPGGEEPQPVNPAEERVRYWCEGCGAEVMLLVRGTPVAPRHCGERMHERREVPHDLER
jgi:DNA-directed RNA polymerase subunit RPC12/RpoP